MRDEKPDKVCSVFAFSVMVKSHPMLSTLKAGGWNIFKATVPQTVLAKCRKTIVFGSWREWVTIPFYFCGGPRANNDNRLSAPGDSVNVGTNASNRLVPSDARCTCLLAYILYSKYPAGSSSCTVSSDASCHVSFDMPFFVSYRMTTRISVDIGSKSKARICWYGDVLYQVRVVDEINRCRLQHDVPVPGFEYSLLSMSKINQNEFNPTFISRTCIVIGMKKTIVAGTL